MTRFISGHSRPLVVLFFLVLTLIGLVSAPDYGLPCDEPAEQIILQENLKEYAFYLQGASSQAFQYYDQQGIQLISESLEKDHGQCAYYLAAPLLAFADTAPHILTVLWHGYTFLWFMAGCLAIYGFSREMGFSRLSACLSSLLLYLAPRFFAEGHYNNKDMVLLALALLCLWLGLRFLKKPCLPRGLLLSLAGAMTANIKVVGLLPWGLMGLCALLLVTARKQWSPAMALTAVSTVLSFICFYALLTPALWQDPLGYFAYVIQNASGFTRWPGVVVFRGMVFDHARNPLPRYYLPYLMLVTLPLYTLPLAALGQLRALRTALSQKAALIRDPQTLGLGVATLSWFLPLAFAFLTRPLVYNGWRHFYFVYAGVALLAAYGIDGLLCLKKPLLCRIALLGLLLGFGLSALGIWQNHPYQYSYYNVLARASASTDMELDYWDVSTVNAMKKLCAAKGSEDLPLALGSRDDMSLFGITHGYQVLPPDIRAQLIITEDENAPYLFYNTTYALIYGVAPPEGYHELLHIEGYGNTLCTVYERDR